ncbi:hypothetical protein NC652_013979 [Populus alba x Populus x berolinensis]|nr:hypothetical protein NC652_013979 [Populus alba x Populus x berolinensis]
MSFASVFGSPILWALNPSTASSFKPINGGIKIAVPAGTGFGYGGLSIECSLRPQKKATAHSHENKAKRESAIGHGHIYKWIRCSRFAANAFLTLVTLVLTMWKESIMLYSQFD